MAKKRQAGKKADGGRPRRPTSERRIKTSYKGRLAFRPGDPHVLDDQVKEARNYRLLLTEQISHLQGLLAEVEQLDEPGAQISQEENALKAFLWKTYQDHKHRDHLLATFLGIRRKRLLERLQAAQIALEVARDFLAPDHRIVQELQQAIEQAHQPQAVQKQKKDEENEEPQPFEHQITHRHIYGDAEHTRIQLAQFDALVKQMRSTITSGIGWFEEFYVTKQRISLAARAYMKKGEPIPDDVPFFEEVLYGPYLKYRWREEGSKRAAIYTVQLGRIPDEERSIADTLVHEGIPAVIAQQANFTYESSQRASEAWYTALIAGQGVAEALFEVRQALSQADRPDWAVPILQGSAACLAPLLDDTALPGPPDPLLTSWRAATDLPAPTGVFVGRHRELRTLRLMLENVPGSGPVLALITGPGGVGKSTLAALAISRSGGKYKAVLTLSCQGYQSLELFLQRMGEFLKRLGAPSFLDQTLPDAKMSTEAKIEEAIAALNVTGPVLLVVDNLESVQAMDQTLRDASLLHLLQKLLTNLRGGRVLITGRYAVKDLLPYGKFAAHLLRLDLDDLSPYETSQLLTRHPTLALLGETVRKTLIHEFGGLPYVYDLLSSDAASQSLDLLVHDVQNRVTQERKQRSAEEWQAVHGQVVEFAALGATVSRLSEASRTLLGMLHQSFPLVTIEQGLGAVRAAWQPLLDWSLLRYDPQERTYGLHSVTRHYAEDLLDEPIRMQAQAQLAAWNEQYADRESHDLTDYLEAHRLWRAAGNLRQAGELVIRLAEVLRRFGLYPLLRELCTTTLCDIGESGEQLAAQVQGELGIIAYSQGDYAEARRLYGQSLAIEKRLGDQGGRATTLHQLGIIAQAQGDYAEARRLYGQSLAIEERLGDQGGRAGILHQLGVLAYKQGGYEHALTYVVQASILFDSLHSPYRDIAQHQIARIRSHMDEATFAAHWRTIAGDRPLPILSDEETNQQLLHLVIDFMQVPTWDEKKRFLESHLDLLQPEVDEVFQAFAAQQEHDDARKTIEEHRLLLARCRNNGIDGAFAEIQSANSPEATFAAELERVCNEVVTTLRVSNAEQQEVLVTRLEQMLKDALPIVGALDFLQMLVAWLRRQDTQALEEKLQPPFRDTYAQMVAVVEQEEVENTEEDNDAPTIEKLARVVSSFIARGTIEQRQEFAASLLENQQKLPPEEEALGNFFGCLAAALRGETPEVASLEAPFSDLWQAFQDALSVAPDEERS